MLLDYPPRDKDKIKRGRPSLSRGCVTPLFASLLLQSASTDKAVHTLTYLLLMMELSKRKQSTQHARQTQLAKVPDNFTSRDENTATAVVSEHDSDEDEPLQHPPKKCCRPGELSRRDTPLDSPRLTRTQGRSGYTGNAYSPSPAPSPSMTHKAARRAREELGIMQIDLQTVHEEHREAVAHSEALAAELQILQAVNSAHTQQLSAKDNEIAGLEAEHT